ncbi:MAG: hypothetical protein IJL21_02050 [Alphaproteobacteria bacterium]|nr:hypothetical protein [Alphaproteobacteria bacterium]
MRKSWFVGAILTTFVAGVANAEYTIGRFTAPRGATGATGGTGSTGPEGPAGPQGCSVSASKSNIYQNPSDPTSRVVGTHVVLTDSCNSENNQEFDVNHGNDGTSFNFKGKKDTCAELEAITGAQQNDAWLVAEDGLLYIYNGTSFPSCPNGGAAFTGPAGEGVCTNVSTPSTAVKNTVRSYSGPSGPHTVTVSGTSYTYYDVAGHITLTHHMCSGSSNDDTSDTQDDRCVPVVAPNGVCTGKTYYECKTQAATTGWTAAQVYYLCVATTYSSVTSAIDNPCMGVASGNLSTTERTQTTAYTVPNGSKTTIGGYSYYTNNPGKIVTTSVKCDPGTGGANNTVIGSVQDDCDEIEKPNTSVCANASKKFYKCRPQGKIGSSTDPYYICTSPLGESVLDAIGTVAADVSTVSGKVTTLETTVGNSTSGLVQQTNNLEASVANKLNKDVSFSKANGYITMSATGISTPVNVVAVADIKGDPGSNGASALELWQEQQTDNATCQKLFGKNCNALGLTEFMQDISDYGVWARAEYQANGANANVSRSAYRATLQPCQGGITLTPNGTDGSGGNKYTMTCTE